jgi:hypothetical protein
MRYAGQLPTGGLAGAAPGIEAYVIEASPARFQSPRLGSLVLSPGGKRPGAVFRGVSACRQPRDLVLACDVLRVRLVLREHGGQKRRLHSFLSEVRPGTFVRMDDRDWIVIDVQEDEPPSVICRPAAE